MSNPREENTLTYYIDQVSEYADLAFNEINQLNNELYQWFPIEDRILFFINDLIEQSYLNSRSNVTLSKKDRYNLIFFLFNKIEKKSDTEFYYNGKLIDLRNNKTLNKFTRDFQTHDFSYYCKEIETEKKKLLNNHNGGRKKKLSSKVYNGPRGGKYKIVGEQKKHIK